jgi:serine/threonine protein kinase/Flp pilus assembly protein TadD
VTKPDEQEIFHAARRIEAPEARRAYLESACGEEPGLRARVEVLLRIHDEDQSFLRSPVGRVQTGCVEPIGEAPGAVLGPYQLLQPLGEGGMGTVFLAEQTWPVRRQVALKVIKPGMDSRQVLARFEAERQALALMDHPNVAKVHDAGATPAGRPYFVMELVQGVPITRFCDDNQLTIRQRLELFVPVCQAVQHAHQKGVIHRDLKPSNVLVASYDGKPMPKIIDFGVAKATGPKLTEETLVTACGSIVGTPAYMSPEQAGPNPHDIDTRSDVFALGVLLYELLTGTTPLRGEGTTEVDVVELLRRVREEELPRPSQRLSTSTELPSIAANRGLEPKKLPRLVRGELDWIVMKCLEKDRTRRYETANGLARDVERYLGNERVEACPPSAGYRLRKFARRHKTILATTGAFAALLVAATVSSIALASWALRERNHAEEQTRASEANFKKALEAVDQMLTRVGEGRLTNVPQMEPVRRDLLQDALRFYQEFLRERGDSPVVRSETANAYRRVGQIQALLGQPEEAEEAFRQAVVLLGKLLDESPDDPSHHKNLAAAHNGLGMLYHSTTRWPQAETHLQRAVALLEKPEAEGLLPLKNRHSLAGIHNNLMILYRQMGQLDKAEAAFFKCKTVTEKLLADDLKDGRSLMLLASCHQNAGFVYGAKGQTREAEAAYQTALTLNQRLIRVEPEEVSHQKRLAGTQNNLGLLYTQTGQHDKAEAAYQESLALNKAILDAHPKVVAFRVDLAGAYGNMAIHVRKTRSAEEALEWSARSISILESVLEQDPRHGAARQSLFDGLMGRGYAYVNLGRQDEAAKDWQRMLEISEGQPDIRIRIYRPFALVFLGEHSKAAAEIETLVAESHIQGRNLLLFAKVHSLCSAAAAAEAQLPLAEREKLADKYGRRAVDLLRQARARGYFQGPGQLAELKESKDLESVRSRSDFQQLLTELEQQGMTKR